LFRSERSRQKFCSPQCCQIASRSRFVIACANQSCGKQFEITPKRYALGSRCCSRRCRIQHQKIVRLCQNPACRKPIKRVSNGQAAKKYGKDQGKYCCRNCYHDHRWGTNRPRKAWPVAANKAASRHALKTSLRKKCKLLGVAFDPDCTREAVCSRDKYICQECGTKCLKEWTFSRHTRRVDNKSAEHDHIVPLTVKGSPGNVFPNSQCLCRKCNNRKRDSARGQLRLDLEGSVKRWEEGGFARNQRRSRSSGAILAVGPSTTGSRSRQPMAL
jgi:5-methylcytosine-specific restriction endonuclease McrA